MADAKKNETKQPAEGNAFKTAPLGFDKMDVNAYIFQLRKEMQKNEDAYKQKIRELEDEISNPKKSDENNGAASSADVEKIKSEYEEKLMEQRKLVLDERRKAAQLDKENARTQMEMKSKREECDKLRELVIKKNEQLKEIASAPQTATGISGTLTAEKASEIIADAQKKANEIVESAKAYAVTVSEQMLKYKTECEAKIADSVKKISQSASAVSAPLTEAEESVAKVQAIQAAVINVKAQLEGVLSAINVEDSTADVLADITKAKAEAENTASQIAAISSVSDVAAFDMTSLTKYDVKDVKPIDVSQFESEPVEVASTISIDISAFDSELDAITSSDAGVLASMELETLEVLADEEKQEEEPDDSFFVVDTEEPAKAVEQKMGKKHTEPEPPKKAENTKISGLEDLFVEMPEEIAPAAPVSAKEDDELAFDDMFISTPSADELMMANKPASADETAESATADFDDLMMSMTADDADSGEMSEMNFQMPDAPVEDTLPVPKKAEPVKDVVIEEIKREEEKGEDLGDELFEIAIDQTGSADNAFSSILTASDDEDDDSMSSMFVPMASTDITMDEVSIADAPATVQTDAFGGAIPPQPIINAVKGDEVAETFKKTTPPPMQPVDAASTLWDFGDAGTEEDDDMSSDNVGVSDLLI